MKTLLLCLVTTFLLSPVAEAKGKHIVNRKTQVVDFDGDTVDGTARTPDAAYLVQKRSVDFVPLYKVKERFDENIRSSINYLE